jgi:4-amino-4-deoxy-L-arabinose transferase-like glycosyltransferase
MSDRLGSYALNRPEGLLLWTIAVGTALRLAAAYVVGLGYNEAYFVSLAGHLQLSYYDHPPLALRLVWATVKVTGSESAFVVRAPFILMFIGTTSLVYRLGTILFNRRVGAISALLFNLSPLFTFGVGATLLPDGPLMPCLLAGNICIARLDRDVEGNRLLLWCMAGLWFGLAMLSKYTAVLVMAGLFVFALTNPQRRRWFRKPGPYLAGVIALLSFSPVLIWNWQNDWASFGFQGARAVAEVDLKPTAPLENLLGQATWVGLWIWIPMMYAYWLGLLRGSRDARSWQMCCAAAVPILFFTVVTIWEPETREHYHWAAPGYLMLFPLLGDRVVDKLTVSDALTRRWLSWSSAFVVLVLIAFGAHMWNGWIARLGVKILPANALITDPTLQLIDWRELRPAVAARGLLDKPRLFVVGSDRREVSKIDVELGKHLPVICLCDDARNFAFKWNELAFLGWDALIVQSDASIDVIKQEYGPFFRKIELLDTVDVHRGNQVVRKLGVFYATDYFKAYPVD